MKVALSRLPDQNLRPVTAWPNRDKLSASWLQCLPGPEGLGSPAFSEALALLLCSACPALLAKRELEHQWEGQQLIFLATG